MRRINVKLGRSTKGISSKVDAQWQKYVLELDFIEALFVVGILGIIAELSPFLMGSEISILLLILPLFYSIFVTGFFLKLRYRLKGYELTAILVFLLCFLATPFSGLAIVNPEIFSSLGFMDVYTSRKFSILFFLTLQMLLIYSAVLLASTSWRTRILNKNKLDLNSLRTLHKNAILKNVHDINETKLDEILSGIPSVRELFTNGEFGMVVTWGWSIIDRTLEALTGTRDDRKGAKKIGFYNREFEKCYQIRNSMVHEGYLPNHQDALSILKRVKVLLRVLSKKQVNKIHS